MMVIMMMTTVMMVMVLTASSVHGSVATDFEGVPRVACAPCTETSSELGPALEEARGGCALVRRSQRPGPPTQ